MNERGALHCKKVTGAEEAPTTLVTAAVEGGRNFRVKETMLALLGRTHLGGHTKNLAAKAG